MAKQPAVYILAGKRNGTISIGVTSNLQQRIWQHKNGSIEGFTKQYRVHLLVYSEVHGSMLAAIISEKQMKKWIRVWKLKLIEEQNPDWRDLSNDI